MASNNSTQFLQNSYQGEVLNDLLAYTVQENETYKKGLVHIKAGIQFKYTIPMIHLGKVIQDNVPTPTSTHGAGTASDPAALNTYTFTERYLEPRDFMIYLEFNPRDFEKYYKEWQPDGNLVFRTLDPQLQAKMLRELMGRKGEWLNEAIWCSAKGGTAEADKVVAAPTGAAKFGGDCAAGPMKYFDGVMMRLFRNISTSASAEEKAGGQAIVAGNTALATGEAVEKALRAIWSKTPAKIRTHNLSYVVSWDVWDKYNDYLTDKNFKYADNRDINDYRFHGKRIVPISSLPQDTILFGEFSNGQNSNVWVGVDYANDTEKIRIDRLQANSEMYFFQMRMKMDVNIVRPGEIVMWSAYTPE